MEIKMKAVLNVAIPFVLLATGAPALGVISDTDLDGLSDSADNCINVANADQRAEIEAMRDAYLSAQTRRDLIRATKPFRKAKSLSRCPNVPPRGRRTPRLA